MTLEELKAFGADTESGMARCMNNRQFYFRLVKMVPIDINFAKLSMSVEIGDLDAAFEAAHSLKGILGNLSITPMYDLVCEMTELLRVKSDVDYTPYLKNLLEKRDQLEKICE